MPYGTVMSGAKRKIIAAALLCLAGTGCSGYKYSGLVPYDEYVGSSTRDPYVLEISAGKGSLLYYGAYHTSNATNPQFADMEERWKSFEPTIALCEGSAWPLEKTREEAIARHGEQGLLRFLADRGNVTVECIDPPLLLQARHLRNFFPAGEIKIYFILRQARINSILDGDTDVAAFAKEFLPVLEYYKTFRFPPRGMYDFEQMVGEYFPELEDWRRIPDEYFFLEEKGRFLPRIHRQLTAYRDQHMLKTLIKKVKGGHRIFAVVGRRHVVTQEPVLRTELILTPDK